MVDAVARRRAGAYAGWLQVEDRSAGCEVVVHLSFLTGDGPPEVEQGLAAALDALADLVEQPARLSGTVRLAQGRADRRLLPADPTGRREAPHAVVKRFAVTILGGALLLLGLAMMVLPGPGILVIVAGLAVLATEYVWAQRLLKRAKSQAEKVQEAAWRALRAPA